MKRFLWLVVMVMVISSLALAGCGGGETTAPTNNPATTAANETITIATDATWAPFEFVNEETKEIEGMDIDIMKKIAELQGLKVTFKNVAWDPLLAGMAQGMYDAAISSITITEERKKDMLFSDPYYAAGQIIVVRKDNTTITGKDTLKGTVGVQLGTTGDIEVQKIAGANTKPYDEIGMAFQDLMNGQVDAVVCDNPVALGYVMQNSEKLKSVGEPFTDEWYGIAVAKGNEALLEKINAGLKTLKEQGLIEQYEQKWEEWLKAN
jgi:polar amino acid transport system substrate-binding protein